MAFVLSLINLSIFCGSIFPVFESISHQTGLAFKLAIGMFVAVQVIGEVMTLSPGLTSAMKRESIKALVPEFVVTIFGSPM